MKGGRGGGRRYVGYVRETDRYELKVRDAMGDKKKNYRQGH